MTIPCWLKFLTLCRNRIIMFNSPFLNYALTYVATLFRAVIHCIVFSLIISNGLAFGEDVVISHPSNKSVTNSVSEEKDIVDVLRDMKLISAGKPDSLKITALAHMFHSFLQLVMKWFRVTQLQ